ncbi:MAG: sensor histidine kinase [Actinomycetota bacterium]|nr:sensor histidine kinase [Actinomycetota bacterium]
MTSQNSIASSLTWALAVLTVVVAVLDLVVVVVAGTSGQRVYVSIAVALAAMIVLLALLVAHHQPQNSVAALLAWMGLVTTVVAFSDTYVPARVGHSALLPALPPVAEAVLVGSWVWLYTAVSLLMLLFPNGRLPGGRWRWVSRTLITVALAVQAVMMTSPGPYDPPYATVSHPFGDLPSALALGLKIVLFPALVGLAVACGYSLRVRYRGGDELLRGQLKWLLVAALAVPLTVLLSWGGDLLLHSHKLALIGFAVLYAGIPLACTIGIVRHDLFDVDRTLSAAATYGVVSAALLTLFVAAAFSGGALLGQHSGAAAALLTAVTTVAITPLRRRLQRRLDRRLYPLRRAAADAVDELRGAIVAGRSEPEQLRDVLRTALRDPDLQVGVYLPGATGPVDPYGEPLQLHSPPEPVLVRGQQIGAIASTGPAPLQLQREVAAQSALLIEMIRLRLELSKALQQAAASRSRLQRIGYEERRNLERDLHDGAQQRLVSLGMTLRLAQRHLDDPSVDINGLLDESVAQLGTAVEELRGIAHGLRPSALNEGLRPALSALADSASMPIELDISADSAIPDDIATTTYYVVSEAVANVVKHAGASRIGLRVVQGEGALTVRIADDGQGGAVIRPGSGLSGLADRVAAAGGWLSLQSSPHHGTVVEVTLPCAS